MAAAQSLNLVECLLDRPGRLVPAGVADRVKDVGDPGPERDLFADDSARVAAAVPPLVMSAGSEHLRCAPGEERLRSYGTPQTVVGGEVLYGPGDASYDLIVTEDATVEIVQPVTREAPEESLVSFGPGTFLGELNLLTGQAVYLIARVVEDGRVHRIAPARFRS